LSAPDEIAELNQLVATAYAWAAQDCDEKTQARCLELAAQRELTQLREYFSAMLEFGTAGLRALVGPGPARMNLATIRKTSFAVGSYLLSHVARPRVVLAYDGRATSFDFARECAGVLHALGVQVLYFAQPTPTPLAAFAVRHLGAEAGIVITASHNPKDYNGFKLYASDGCQIIAPIDADIARRMANAGPARTIECQPDEAFGAEGMIAASVEEAYFAELRRLYTRKADNVSVAYTALHGVGGALATRAFTELGVRALHVVEAQHQPDPEFSTVAFPNPEEPGVMDRVTELARRNNAQVALATDPDADRLGVVVRDERGQLVQLSGNQVGLLLAQHALLRHSRRRDADKRQALVVQSVVSCPMLGEMAAAFGARYERTLTGFKWICRPALALGECQYVFGYEEALGYSVSANVLDKDGVSAAVVFIDVVAECERAGKCVAESLFELYQRFGLWVSVQHTVTLPGRSGVHEMERAMNELRKNTPKVVGDVPVTALIDYRHGAENRPFWLGATNLIELQLGDKGRILVRPSGTEPKLKIYVDYRGRSPTSFARYFEQERELIAECRELAALLAFELGLEPR
jgi:phosphomannomutase